MTVITQEPQKKLIVRIAEKFGVEKDKLLETLKATAFKQKEGVEISNEQMMALLIVAEQYRLNPFTKELYAYPDKGGIVPVVSVDGWSRIINMHPQFDGMEFKYSDTKVRPPGAKVDCNEWIEVSIHRKDRSRPTVVREYLDEVYREPFTGTNRTTGKTYTTDGTWQSYPKRMLRHKGVIQCARLALGFTGIVDDDEADAIVDMGQAVVVTTHNQSTSAPEQLLLEQAKVDPIVQELIKRAKGSQTWEPAYAFAQQRFSGQVGEYVKQKLRDAEIESMPSAMENFAATVAASAPDTIEASAPETVDDTPTGVLFADPSADDDHLPY